ncbi:NEW3 domain-containing protein [Chelativorans sp.]|uniref:COG1470 family protein n=1 Tax=Chelativorans sp. TaxID=2203393 RepID=UPI002811B906|nr:NEW3 domain-containing protein [Chelativorans sp.]
MIPAHAFFARKTLIKSLSATFVVGGLLLGTSSALAQTAPAPQPPGAAVEQELQGLWLTTPYPAFFAQPGEEVDIGLSLANKGLPPQRVEFAISGLPEGWQWEIEGDGKRVGAAIAASDQTIDLSLKLTPAEGAVGDTYQFTITGKSGNQTLELPIALTLAETQPAELTLKPELPALRGTVRSTFDYQVEIANDGQEDTVVNLLAEAAPGFQVTFKERYGSQELTSIPLAAGEKKNLSVTVKAPENAQAGQYPVMVRAAGGNAAAETQLVLDITGQAELALAGPGGRLSGDATAGEQRTFNFTVENRGTAPARAVKFSASPPSGWNVEFNPEEIAEIPAGESAEVAVNMTPSDQAIAGDYVVTVRANGDGASDNESFRVTVRTSTIWGVTGLGVIAAAVMVLGFAVTRYGRR